MENLTQKQNKFTDVFVETGVASEAARQAYKIPADNKHLAAVIGSENLTKPDIIKAIEEKKRNRAKLVESATDSLLTAVRLDYFVFPRSMDDKEIHSHVEAQGLTVLNIRPSDKGKLAFFSLPDGASRAKGIEIHHKVEGTFAPEKKIVANIEVEASPRLKDIANQLNALHRGGSITGDGTTASTVGTQAQHKDGDGSAD